jgi:lipoprotein-anchoring transpeptidase ErfK/SrfK
MRFGPGVEGVTERFAVPAGWAPLQIVSRQKLPYGHNALLYWNHAGNLDPTRLRAGDTLLLPKEELTLQVHVDYRLLGVFVGDWFVKEFKVGVGKAETPTPRGWFTVEPKHENPDWHSKDGVIRFGDPRNELGDAWIPIVNEENPRSYGIHGTNRPDSVGSACSEGCVRLSNSDVKELFWWVRSANAGGPATRVWIR